MSITSSQLYALCADAEVDHKTGRKWLNPSNRARMKRVVAQRIARPAAKLGIQTEARASP
jgi:hypothetical protein